MSEVATVHIRQELGPLLPALNRSKFTLATGSLLLLLLSACTTDGWDRHDTMRMTIINTTDNTYRKNGEWRSNAGPLSDSFGGLACDNAVGDMRYHSGEYFLWHLAPSDSTSLLGMKKCASNGYGEPSCAENLQLCGRKVRIKCLTTEYCGQQGEPSLLSQINHNVPPINNYLPNVYVDELTRQVGKYPKATPSMVLYITDFCPASHSDNKRSRQCQGPQIDVSTPAFLLMGKTNDQGYINTNVKISVELLDANDTTPAGPEYR